jgi:hypothetical protein
MKKEITTAEDARARIIKLNDNITDNEYWLRDGGMSNKIKISMRRRDIKDDKKEIEELKLKFNL